MSGCASVKNDMMVGTSVDYNLVVEKVGNELLFLNVVRGFNRRPMYFTTFTSFKGSMTYGVETGGIYIPFGKFGTTPGAVYSVAPKVTYSSNPLVEIAVLNNTKDFTDGMLNPIPLRTIMFFLQQGWYSEQLLYLFVRNIKIDKILYGNYPEEPEKFEAFRNKLKELFDPAKVSCEITEYARAVEPIGPPFNANEIKPDLKTMIELHKAELKLDGVGSKGAGAYEKYQLKPAREQKEYVLQCRDKNTLNILHRLKEESSVKCEEIEKCIGVMTLRSPEAVIYYLGQIMRAQDQNKTLDPKIKITGCENEEPVPLFVARKSTPADKAPYVAVNYDGDEYVIPRLNDSGKRCETDRSMQILELVSLLIAKQVSAKDLPPPASVVAPIGR